MKKQIKKAFKKTFKKLGYKISKVGNTPEQTQNNNFTMLNALRRCKERGLDVNTVIDVGASNGMWTRECLPVLPNAKYLLVEAQEGHVDALNAFVKKRANVQYTLAAAGSGDDTIFFDNSGLFGGVASKTPFKGNYVELPMISLDNEVERRNLKGPFLLKLDTHGFEVPILEGAKQLIKQAQLVVIECYNFKLSDESLRFYEMCDYMKQLGFSPIEMVDFMNRKYDNSFWQLDIFFVPTSSKSFSHNAYI